MSVLRDGTWAKADRLLLIGAVASISYFISNIFWQIEYAKVMPDGEVVLVTDFLSFWMAGKQALMGASEIPYTISAFMAVQEPYNEPGIFFTFFYPPMYLLLVMPLGLLGSIPAYVAFQSVFAIASAVVLRKIARHWMAVLLVFGTPAAYMNLVNGQNGFLTAFLFAAGLLCLRNKRPVLAGVCIGFLTIKPQLGVLLPFALLAGRYWSAFVSAVVTTVLFAAVSWIAFGSDTWLAFIEQIPAAQLALTGGYLPIHHVASIFGAVVGAGGSIELGSTLQAIVGTLLVCLVVWVWSGPASFDAKAVVLLAASTLISPFILVYDLSLLSIAIAFVAGSRNSLKDVPWVITLCAAALVITAFNFGLARSLSVQIGPFAGLFVLIAGLKLVAYSKENNLKTGVIAVPPARGE